ncbi:methionyl-tRNA formyltransferase [Desmospora profundinema]|uniref:Methionyl-tRNA formyltransferase n=1 Tax=Desmospora profundinema TaxID=1571184 RepID=A0ABU1IR09_9BACL|nr:methionyl-tRNA formyltransferase [Desmospora profundinema]MDR6227231.1 methionyl-tRNA formyltransferase [Desmospora profundinema]
MEHQTRIVFMGTPDFAVPSLRALVTKGYRVVGVVTQPDRPRGRKRILTPPPVKVAAKEWDLPVFQPERVRSPEALDELLAWEPDLIVTAAYGQILPRKLLETPRHGCINVHASLLPRYRGGAPIHHALIQGEKETGVTIMYMVEALDAGDMLAQESIPIEADDDVASLHDKLSRIGADLLLQTLPPLLRGEITPVPQDPDAVTFAPNIRRQDERIDWNLPAPRLADQVRGLRPWPVAFTTWEGKPLKIWRARAEERNHREQPGTVLCADASGVIVAAGEGVLVITELQPAGKKPMSVESFVRGRNLDIGQRLGDG